MPPLDRSSQTTTSSAKPRRRMQASTRAFTRARLRRGTTRSSAGCVPSPSRPAASDSDSIQMEGEDRKSTRLNSSHVSISYAVFCLKKKKDYKQQRRKGGCSHSVLSHQTTTR